jgi:hypothetical protein
MRILRWMLVPLAAFGVWVAALLVGLGGISLLDRSARPT